MYIDTCTSTVSTVCAYVRTYVSGEAKIAEYIRMYIIYYNCFVFELQLARMVF